MRKILEKITTLISIIFNNKILRKPDFSEKKIFLTGKLLADRNEKKIKINSLKDVEFSVFSQFGEDGIINWLTHQIPNIKKIFLEIGTQDYWESNTRFLLKSKLWKGYIIEGSKEDVDRIKSQRIYWQNDITAINKFINLENVTEVINKEIKQKHIGLFSLDIDGNDYWILKKINLNADIIVTEYNPIFGDIYKISVPYEKDFVRGKKHFSNLFFGCSINALIDLMKKKNYIFLGTNSCGMNAFFVSKKKYQYIKKKLSNIKIFPPILREGRTADGKLNFKNIKENFKQIKNLKIYDVDKNRIVKLSEFKELYSKKWQKNFN